jgi:hypothetical protein
MTPQQFIAKWQKVNLSERSACQQHFLDLCELLDQPKPAEADPEGEWYTFEKGVTKTDGGDGWADVWMRGHFGWEYKETRPRYTPTTCFEKFPFPISESGMDAVISHAACDLNRLRNDWLNPPEWTKTEVLELPGSVDGPWARYIDPATVRLIAAGSPHPNPLPEGEGTSGIGTVRWPRIVPKDADCAASLKKRTLTNLYNQRPTWLDLAHQKLDAAVFAAYGWDAAISDEELLERLLKLNLERSTA